MKVLSKSMQGHLNQQEEDLEIKAFFLVYNRFIFVFINSGNWESKLNTVNKSILSYSLPNTIPHIIPPSCGYDGRVCLGAAGTSGERIWIGMRELQPRSLSDWTPRYHPHVYGGVLVRSRQMDWGVQYRPKSITMGPCTTSIDGFRRDYPFSTITAKDLDEVQR